MNHLPVFAWLCSCALMIGGCATRPEEKVVVEKLPTFRPVADETQPRGRGPAWEKSGRRVTVTTIPVGAPVFNLVYGEGKVWVMGRKFTKIDPESNGVATRFSEASACAVGVGEGSIWAIPFGLSSHDVRRLDSSTGKIVARIHGIVPGGFPYIIAWPTVGEGSVWIYAGGKVLRLDPKTNRVLATIPTVGTLGIIAVGERAVWVLEKTSVWPKAEGLVSQVDPSDNHLVGTAHLGYGAFSIAVGEGAVWVAQAEAGSGNDLTRGKLLRIDPKSLRIVRAIPLFDTPNAIAVAAGSVWVGSAFGPILRVDPKINQVVESLGRSCLGSSGGGLVVGAGALWIGQFRGCVQRIDLQDFTVDRNQPASE